MKWVVVAALTAAMQMPGAPGGTGPHVSIGYGDYDPAKIDVLAGDTVGWSNDSTRNHTVTDDAGAFDSGVLPSTGKFAHLFDHPGTFPYHCRLHPYIRGVVDVWNLLLDTPGAPAQADSSFPLNGRAALPADTTVTIEADDGSGYKPAGTTTVAGDGTFTALVTPHASASYRAVAGDQASPPVQVLVLNHQIVASSRRGRRATVVSVTVTPADPGGTVVLQLHLRERFGWWPVTQARLDRSSRARFVVRIPRDVSARARLTLPDGATPLATSPLVRVGPPPRTKR